MWGTGLGELVAFHNSQCFVHKQNDKMKGRQTQSENIACLYFKLIKNTVVMQHSAADSEAMAARVK